MAEVIETRAAVQGGPGNPLADLLTPEGMLTSEAERAANVSNEALREMYRLMVVCRRLDEEGLRLQRQGELGLWGPIAGHEAAQVGAARAMAPDRLDLPLLSRLRDGRRTRDRPRHDDDVVSRPDSRRMERPRASFRAGHHLRRLASAARRRLRDRLQARQ